MLPEGTVILSRTASVGYSGVLGREMATSQDFVCWVCGPKLDPMYLLFGLRAMRREFGRLLTGSTHKTIYMPDAYDFQIPLPPLPEQEELVSFIKRKVDEIDALLHKYTGGVVVKEVDKGGQRGLVSLLLELRRNLTFEVVTGKVDVRSDALAEPVIDTEEVAA
jgi:type I restriction enzyme S subunit